LTRPPQHARHRALGKRTCRGGRTCQWLKPGGEVSSRLENLDTQCTLPCRRQTDRGLEQASDTFRHTQPPQACGSQNDGVVFALVQLAETRIQIASQRLDLELRKTRPNLRLAAQAGSTHDHA